MQLLYSIFCFPPLFMSAWLPHMAASLTLIATIKPANRNANNKWCGPPKCPRDKWKERKIKTERVGRRERLNWRWVSAGLPQGDVRKGEEPLWSCLIPVFIGPATEGSLCYTQAENHHTRRGTLCTQQTGTVNEKYYKKKRLSCLSSSLPPSVPLSPFTTTCKVI